ncbi:MAG: toll/interleukin-1 receptor domain-containing protein [Betaproteobacteria bacterium]|nr:MAG: toll/interleukin-1 receptor domain-containing protein [Betaproteobacteria bacterium]
MLAFISHNKVDKATARLLAAALVEMGANVWFDEWNLRPGDSITGGIENGISTCDVFVLIWSTPASQSNWIGMELRAIVTRRVNDDTLRVVPVMVDETPLPALVAEYKGFNLATVPDLRRIASEITGVTNVRDVAHMLQKRLHELADAENDPDNPIRVVVCPQCASKNLSVKRDYDHYSGSDAYFVLCLDCPWGTAQKVKGAEK